MSDEWVAWRDRSPNEVGWYPTSETWDAEEGPQPGALWWSGREWRRDPDCTEVPVTPSILYLPRAFETDELARRAAYAVTDGRDLEEALAKERWEP